MPEGTPFRTKPQLALDMLRALVAEASLPVRWVTCNEGFSVSHAFLDGVAALGLGYLAEVARNTHVWTARPAQGGSPSRPVFSAPSQEVGTVADQLPPAAWRPFVLRDGSKGPQAVLCAVLRVVARLGLLPGPDIWLLLRRNPATDELKCYLSNGPADMPADRLVWLAGLRWPIEQCFRDGQQLFGLGDYEGHRHATLVMLAHFFVVRETLRLISSLPADARSLLQAGRRHWGIENSLHWVLDMAFREDESRIRIGHAAHNLSILRRMALNLLRRETTAKGGMAARRKQAGWNDGYLLKVLSN